jgi:hypothetical protein
MPEAHHPVPAAGPERMRPDPNRGWSDGMKRTLPDSVDSPSPAAARSAQPDKPEDRPMTETPPRISVAEMEKKHVVRYAACNGSDLAYLDQRLPGHEREIVNVIGMNVTENMDDPALEPKLGSAYGFSLVYNKAIPGMPKGAGPAFHSHLTEEVFIPMKGVWEVVWLEGETERAIALEPLDVVSVPTGIYRGFRCVSGEADALMLAIVGGPDAGHVAWHPSVIARARATGLEVDDQGNLKQAG